MIVKLKNRVWEGRSPYYERPVKKERPGDDITVCLNCKKENCKGECEEIKRKCQQKQN